MGDVNKVLGACGAPLPVVVGGRTLLLSPLTKKAQAGIETWLEERALAVAERRMRPLLDERGWTDLLHKINGDIAAGLYSFGGPKYQEAVGTWAGLQWMTFALLRPNHPDLTLDEVGDLLEEHGAALLAAVERVANEYEARVVPEGQRAKNRPGRA